ncbi:hypothetical protein [Terricaulis sp.]|uniref:hypothetical protein n=1 Tax=Terricaulis sp. TaxID=2768686 RepID=UPI002AC6FF25|nr:hypothetical protein [Terricaulis sp.]MDZ4691960.1 hypothetical protein [Terricaulis sp.]
MIRAALAAAILLAVPPSARAEDFEEFPSRDSTRPAVGEWIGNVSWNDTRVGYGWTIYPNGAFGSSRIGRGQDGASGTWGAHAGEVILKYASGFRYEGALHSDIFSGTAFTAEGRVFGAFSMHRASKTSAIEESP